jgi:hypothetical protein
MRKFKILILVIAALVLAQPLMADVDSEKLENQLKSYMNDITREVKSAEDSGRKRAILNETLLNILSAVKTVEELPATSAREQKILGQFKDSMQDKYDELNGLNGFERVADEDLDAFADYVLQDLEQARSYITMGLGVFILLIILIILIA